MFRVLSKLRLWERSGHIAEQTIYLLPGMDREKYREIDSPYIKEPISGTLWDFEVPRKNERSQFISVTICKFPQWISAKQVSWQKPPTTTLPVSLSIWFDKTFLRLPLVKCLLGQQIIAYAQGTFVPQEYDQLKTMHKHIDTTWTKNYESNIVKQYRQEI